MAANPDPGRRADAGPRNGPAAPPPDPDAEDYYEMLGVPYGATGAEIARAYRAAMKRIHPDRQRPDRRAAAEEQAKRLNRAYSTLAKPLARLGYDRSLRAQVIQDQIMSRYVGGFYPPQPNGADPFADRLRRPPTTAERREQARADRGAFVSIVAVFAIVTLAVVGLLLLWATAAALLDATF